MRTLRAWGGVETPLYEPYIYPWGAERQYTPLRLELTFSPQTDLSRAALSIPPLKYNKSLLLLLSQDDCKHAAFSTTWAAIHNKPLSDTYYYRIAQLRGNDLPPDTYRLGKTLGSTDGFGHEVRFSFTTTLAPWEEFMTQAPVVNPGWSRDYYRFYMNGGLTWQEAAEMLNYDVGIAFHDVPAADVHDPQAIASLFLAGQQLIAEQLNGRQCKMLAEPNGNKSYVEAARQYTPIRTVTLQSGGVKLRPFAVQDDLEQAPLERRFLEPEEVKSSVQSVMQQPLATREAVLVGVHATDRKWAELLLWLNDNYGKEGRDCLWMPSQEEYFEYNYLRRHTSLALAVDGNKLIITANLPNGAAFYYPSLTLNLQGVDPSGFVSVTANEEVTGLCAGAHTLPADPEGSGEQVLTVQVDCRSAALQLAEHFVQIYETSLAADDREDARYFTERLRPSEQKQALLRRLGL